MSIFCQIFPIKKTQKTKTAKTTAVVAVCSFDCSLVVDCARLCCNGCVLRSETLLLSGFSGA